MNPVKDPDVLCQEFTAETDMVCQNLQKQLSKLRTGRANPALLEDVSLEAYGNRTTLDKISSISVSGPRMLGVQVWDATLVGAAQRAIQQFGLNPLVEGCSIRVPLPEPTGSVRDDLVKEAKKTTEEAKIQVRHLRHRLLDNVDKKTYPEDIYHALCKSIQKITDTANQTLEGICAKQEAEIHKH